MKKIFLILGLVLFSSLAFSQTVTITKLGDQLQFSGFPVGNGSINSSTRFNQIYAASVDQVLVKGNIIYFVNTASKGVVAQTVFSKIADKLGQSTPQSYVEKIIELGYLDKTGIKHALDTVFIGTNRTQGVHYFPDTVGICMDGFKNMSLAGYITEGNAVNDSIYLQVTNDYGINWQTVYGYSCKTNTTVNQLKQTGAGTTSIAWSFPDLNFKYFRVVGGFGDATNVVRIWARKTN